MNAELRAVQVHFAKLYGLRNLFVNGPYEQRAVHVERRIGRLADAERKNQQMNGSIARTVSYFMSVVNYFQGHLDLNRGMIAKFPSYGCSYCHEPTCVCHTGHRPDPIEREPDPAQFCWTIRDWQNHLLKVYGPRNIENGFWPTLGRLMSEFGELGILVVHGPKTPNMPTDIIAECEREAADAFSWILTIAYVKGIDLQEEVLKRYKVCPGCNLCPCDCPLFKISEDGRHVTSVMTQRNTTNI